MVVKIQRWWRSVLLLRGLEVEVALPMPIRLPKVRIMPPLWANRYLVHAANASVLLFRVPCCLVVADNPFVRYEHAGLYGVESRFSGCEA